MESGTNRKRTTKRQQELLLEVLHANKEMVRGNTASPIIRDKWANLASHLNSLGCSRDVKEWQSAWTLWANKVKAKARKVHDTITGTGGGPAGPVLSDQDDRVLYTIGRASVYGFEDLELGLPDLRVDDLLQPPVILLDLQPELPTGPGPLGEDEQAAEFAVAAEADEAVAADVAERQPQPAPVGASPSRRVRRRVVPRPCRGQPNSPALMLVQALNENSRLMRETLRDTVAELSAAITAAIATCPCRNMVQRQ